MATNYILITNNSSMLFIIPAYCGKDNIPTKPLIFLFTCSRAYTNKHKAPPRQSYGKDFPTRCVKIINNIYSKFSTGDKTTFLKRLVLQYLRISKNLLISKTFRIFKSRCVSASDRKCRHASLLQPCKHRADGKHLGDKGYVVVGNWPTQYTNSNHNIL